MITPRFLEASKEKIRPAEQENFWNRRVATSERCEILVDDGLEQRSDDFFDGHSRFKQRIGIGFRKDAALAAHLVQRVARVAHLGEFFCRNLQFACCLFDEGACAARTSGLHQNLFALVGFCPAEENGLHIFAANFADEAHRGMNFFDGCGDRHNFLNRFPSDKRSDEPRARAGEKNAVLMRREFEFCFQASEKL